MTIPPHRSSGDTQHTEDHNAIVDTLDDQAEQLDTLSSGATIWKTTGGNLSTIGDTTTQWARVNLPTGDRSSAADTFAVYAGSRRIFALSGYGESRFTAADDGRPPLIIGPASVAQYADLTQWTKVDGTPIAGVRADGSIYAPNLVSSGWQPLRLNAGFQAFTDFSYAPAYRIRGREIRLRGTLVKTDGSAFTGRNTVLTLPASQAPSAALLFVTASGASVGNHTMWTVAVDINTDGTVVVRLTSAYGSGVPTWVALDGISWEMSAGGDSTITVPTTPTGLKVTATTSSSVSLSWNSSSTATGYKIYKGGSLVGTSTSATFTATSLAASTTYAFQVSATNSAGESPLSTTVNGKTASSSPTTRKPIIGWSVMGAKSTFTGFCQRVGQILCFHNYDSPNDGVPSSYSASAVGDAASLGATVAYMSIRPDIAQTASGALDAQLTALAKTIPAGTYFSWWAEGEASRFGHNKTDFRNGLKRVYQVMKAANPGMLIGPCFMTYSLTSGSGFPLDDWILSPITDSADFISWDGYNSNASKWTSFQSIMAPAVEWTKSRADIPIVIGETNSVEDPSDPNHRGQWWTDAWAWAKTQDIPLFCGWQGPAVPQYDIYPSDTAALNAVQAANADSKI